MPSIRKKLIVNLNDSKNTRMNFGFSEHNLNLRPDELAHLSRYDLAIRQILEEQELQKKPIRILDMGCGEMLALSIFYAAYQIEKKSVIREYIGYDIDENLNKIKNRAYYKGCNANLILQDLTVKPKTIHVDNSFDFAMSFEVVEHMKPKFVEGWIKEVKRVLKPGKKFLLSTPNHSCSNQKLPKDHVHEWGFDELKNLLQKHFKIEHVTGGFMQLRFFWKMIKAAQDCHNDARVKQLTDDLRMIEKRFGLHWTRVILAFKYPEASQNCIWHLRKEK